MEITELEETRRLRDIQLYLLEYLIANSYYIHDENRNMLARNQVLEEFFSTLKEQDNEH